MRPIPYKTTSPLQILVVEDDALIGMLLSEMLESMGHTVCAVALNQRDAVSAALHYKPDLMLVDARLRQGCGIAAVTEILQHGFVPHAFVTGDTADVQSRRPDAVIIDKPFREQDLLVGIQQALERRHTPPPLTTVASDKKPIIVPFTMFDQDTAHIG